MPYLHRDGKVAAYQAQVLQVVVLVQRLHQVAGAVLPDHVAVEHQRLQDEQRDKISAKQLHDREQYQRLQGTCEIREKLSH